jgi:beta-glucosidase
MFTFIMQLTLFQLKKDSRDVFTRKGLDRAMHKLQFPEKFFWGFATASYQIEGAVHEDGRGESIWDRFCHTPGKIINDDVGDVACDHYHLYEDDVRLMSELNVNSYRLSIAWPRIFPEGRGMVNQKGLDFYKRLIDSLNKRNIVPAVTLYHWDLPQKLQDIGGWTNRDVTGYFEDYSSLMFRELGDRVPIWITHNEPWCVSFLSNWIGKHAPGNKDFKTAILIAHNLLLSHGKVVNLYRSTGLKGEIGITLNMGPTYPASGKEEDIAAAERLYGHSVRWFIEPVLKGSYPPEIVEWYRKKNLMPEIQNEDMKIICAPIDFIGTNYYLSAHVRHDSSQQPIEATHISREFPRTDMGWEIHAEGFYDLLIRLRHDYGDIKIMITENGAAFDDIVEKDGSIRDLKRLAYLRDHFTQVHRAIKSGVNIIGYYVWSFIDNFEWAEGFSKRFGVVYVDYTTQKRTVKSSGKWFAKVAEANSVVE